MLEIADVQNYYCLNVQVFSQHSFSTKIKCMYIMITLGVYVYILSVK